PERLLYEEIVEVALNSAFKDPRFPPLEREELNEIEIEISLLSPMKRAKIEDIEVGKHGIYIKKGFYRGILLPQVAVEHNWDKETFLKYTCLKAGLSEDCYLDPEVEIYIFTAEIFREKDL
ncbi:MAG: AmmeMemoRadiSam system protein A, partial [Caldimicrobium sp.]